MYLIGCLQPMHFISQAREATWHLSFTARSLTRGISRAESLNMRLNIGNKIIPSARKLQSENRSLVMLIKTYWYLA